MRLTPSWPSSRLSACDYSQKKRKIFDSGSDLDRCGRLEHCANSGLACKASFILDAGNSNRPSIKTYLWDMVKRQPGIHQRHSDCGAFYPQDPVLVRSNRNRRQHGAPRIGIGAMPGSMSALPEPRMDVHYSTKEQPEGRPYRSGLGTGFCRKGVTFFRLRF